MHTPNSEMLPPPTSPPRALIADDQPDVLTALRLLLRNAGYQIEAATSPAEVLEAIQHSNFDLVLMDLNYARDTTSGQEGLDLITNIRSIDSSLPIVVLTAWGSVELAVEAMHRGGRDFVLKPWDNSALLKSLNTQIELGRKKRQRRLIEAENRTESDKLHQELEESHEIQAALMPKSLPAIEGFDIAATWTPARTVGGDYYDVLKFSHRHTALCIADVAGKGMPAALLMSNVQAVLKSVASAVVEPAELCARVNRVVCDNIVSHRFITCFYALLDTQSKKLSYTNAGHCPPMLIRNGECLRLKEGGPVLGIFPDRPYAQGEIELSSGDCLVLFTDGVTEAREGSGREFGEDRLEELLMELLGAGQQPRAGELRDQILGAVNEFSDGDVYDDATLMVVRVD
ncbi:MAG TPA: SpoIIE family protein phosphatase [Pyrinomonadaceae bacterium]|nr:SpoIIE family protein phosphatase [Pyrinomonadaceae bacterium]